MMRWLEVAATDERIVVPAGQAQAGQQLARSVSGDEFGRLRRLQRIDRANPPDKVERRKRIAPAAPDLDAESSMIEPDPGANIDGRLDRVCSDEQRLYVALPRTLGAHREAERQDEPGRGEATNAGAVTLIEGLPEAPGDGETRKERPPTPCLELLRQVRGADSGGRDKIRVGPRVARFDRRARDRAVGFQRRVVADPARGERGGQSITEAIIALGDEKEIGRASCRERM